MKFEFFFIFKILSTSFQLMDKISDLNHKKEELLDFKKATIISQSHIMSFLNVKMKTNKDQNIITSKFLSQFI